MAYIIAHGTVNGYRKITQGHPIGTEQKVLTDIRAEFDNTQTMLNKSFGYLIQMAEKGVWLSIVKLLFDGERSGNGTGFWAFSAFIPNNQIVDGKVIKQTLESLLAHYLTEIGGDFTKNIGVDWSFVEQATADLNSYCKPRFKPAPINYKEDSIDNKQFAYVNVSSEEEIEQYLGKPFQPEYGKYRAVFLGTYLQNPAHLAAQKPLVIDFGNEVYDIIWQGDANKYPNMHLPQSIRKKEIETEPFAFHKQCYTPKTIRFSDGRRDDSNATITLSIPELEPKEYVVQFSINFPEAVSSIKATRRTDRTYQQIDTVSSEDKHSLVFKGEEALSTWHVYFKTTDKFDDYEKDIVPYENNVSTIPNGIGITLQELRTVSLQILLDGKECTITEKSKILQIYNKKLQKNESQEQLYNKNKNCLELRIPADKSVEELYSFSLFNQYAAKYELSTNKVNESSYRIVLKTKKGKCPSNCREIEIRVPNRLDSNQIYYYDGCKRHRLIQQDCARNSYYIHCSGALSRDNISFFLNGKELRCRKVGDNSIEIIGTYNILYRALDWLRNYYRYIIYGLVGLLLVLLLSVLILFILDKFGYVDAKQWLNMSKQENVTRIKDDSVNDQQTASIDYYDSVRCELDSVYQIQKSQWNMSECKRFCEKYQNEKSEELKNNDSVAYMRLKQLSWLWRTREKIDNRNWDTLITFVKEGNTNYESTWKRYQTSEIRDTILQIISPSNSSAGKKAFEKAIENDADFDKKTFKEVADIWKNCQNPSQSSTGKEHSAKKVSQSPKSKDNHQAGDNTMNDAENF